MNSSAALPMGRVLVTGATGFLGGHFCRRLLAAGVEVRGAVREGGQGRLPAGARPAPIRDLSDREGVRRAVQGVDTVVHLAARVHVLRDRAANPLQSFRAVNVEGTRLLLEEAASAGVGRFLFLSSVSALGVLGRPRLTDASPPAPETPYGQSKLEAERLVEEIAGRNGLRAVILRPPGIYGEGMKGNILRLFRLVDRGVPVPAPAAANRRSLVFVENLLDAAFAALARARVGARAYLVSDAEALSTAELVRAIGDALGRRARLVPVPERPVRALGRLGDRANGIVPFPLTSTAVDRLFGTLVVEPSAIREDTGFVPRYSVREGLDRTAAWYRAAVSTG